MPGAVIVANQEDGAGPGSPGVARNDLWQDLAVELLVGTSGNTTYLWELTDVPPGSAAVLTSTNTAVSGFNPDLVGTYRVRLTTNDGGPGNVQVLVFRVRFDAEGELADRGWALPAYQETPAEANYNGNTRGWAQVFESILADIRVAIEEGGGGGGGPELEALQTQVDELEALVTTQGGNITSIAGGVTALAGTLDAVVSSLAALRTEMGSRVVELPFAAGQFSDAISSWTRAGSRSVDLSKYPATLGTKTRQVRFFAVFENSGSGTTFFTEARLFNYTNAEVVATSTLSNSEGGSRTVPEDRGRVLTQGTTAGTLRTDAPALYEVQFRANGTLTPPNDRAVLSSARLEIAYV